jgi:predicted transcriptional regulator
VKYRFGPALVEAVRVRGLTLQQVASMAEISPSTLSAALAGQSVQMATALRIARAIAAAPVIAELRDLGSGLGE